MTLRELDGKCVAVSLSVQGREVVLCGKGCFQRQAEAGPRLQIQVDDPSGSFDILILESEWDGDIELLDNDCRYLIRLSQSSVTRQ